MTTAPAKMRIFMQTHSEIGKSTHKEEGSSMKRIMTQLFASASVAVFCIAFVGYITDRVGVLF